MEVSLSARWFGWLAAAALLILAPSASADRAFTPRFSDNVTGNIVLIGNTSMTCPSSVTTCAAARDGTATGTANNNNGYSMVYVDQDGDASTYNSSSATLQLPADAFVLWAGLYWGGDSGSATDPGRSRIRFKQPGAAAYTSLTAFQTDAASSSAGGNADYGSFVDVTQIVRTAGPGVYWGADILSTTGVVDKYAGWSLIVAYRSGSEPARNLTVFDGYRTVNTNGNSNVNVTVSGFRTPPAGPVETALGVVSFEGDRGLTGDQAKINNVVLSDAVNPATNFFNSTISRRGVTVTDKNPNYNNQLGLDIDQVTTGVLGNNATSATLNLSTTGDFYYPVALTFATLIYAPQIALQKSHTDLNGGALRIGDVVEFGVVADNAQGRDDALNVVITDVIPPEMTYVPGSATVSGVAGAVTPTYDAATRTLTANIGAMAAVTGRVTLTFRATVNAGLLPGTVITNTANVTYNGAVQGTALATASNPVQVEVTVPDLEVTKSPAEFTSVAGGTQGFRLQVRNAGTAPTADGVVTVTDTFDATPYDRITAVSAPGWACTPATLPATTPATLTCTRSDGLAAGASYPPIDVTLRVADVPRIGPVANTVRVTSAEDPDTATNNRGANNVSTVTGTHVVTADVSVAKTPATRTVNRGQTVEFDLAVTNAGPSTARNVSLTDTMPPALTSPTVVTAPTDVSCSVAGQRIACNLPDLAAGESRTVRVSATAATAGTYFNSVAATTSSADPDTTDNDARAQVTINAIADLGITKSVAPTGTVLRGQALTYTLTVTNHSTDTTATGVSVHDALPAGVTAVTPTGCTANTAGTTLDCPLADIAPGASATVTVTATADGVGFQRNSASVSGALADPNAQNNVAVADVTVVENADLAITKTATPAVDSGGTVTYGLTVTNGGPDVARNVVVLDTLPTQVDPTTVTFSDTRCALSGSTVRCDLGDVASGAPVTLTITAVLRSDETVTVANNATVASDTPDPDADDRQARATTTIIPVADLAITKAGPTSDMQAYLGNLLSYRIAVTNAGPSTAHGVTVIDDLPARVDLVDVTVTTGAGTCRVGGRRVTCTLDSVPVTPAGDPGTVITIRFRPNAVGDITNVATVDPGTATDRDPSDNQDAHTFTAIRRADLSVTKAITSPATPTQNNPLTYSIEVLNAGPNTATDVILTDQLPPDFTVTALPAGCTQAGLVITCDLGDVPAGERRTLTITGTPTAPTLGINTAIVTTSATDANLVDNRADTPGIGTPTVANLSLRKTGPSTLNLSGTGTYILTAANAQGGSTVQALISDQIPSGLTVDGTPTVTGGTGGSCVVVAGTDPPLVRCEVTLAGGESATVSVPVRATSPAGTVTNAATITGAGSQDPDLADNTASASTTIVERADIAVTKTINGGATATVAHGAHVRYVLNVESQGPDPARRVTISDVLPDAFTHSVVLVAESGGAPNLDACRVVTGTKNLVCDFGTMNAGWAYTVTVTGTASAVGSLDNTAFATMASPDTTPGDNSASVTGTSQPNVDLSVTKTGPASFDLDGAAGTYTLVVANAGTTDAPDTRLVDVLPRGLEPADAPTVTGQAGATCAVTDGVVTCELGTVAAGATGITVSIPVRAVTQTSEPRVVTSVANTATVASAHPDADPSDNVDTVTSRVVEEARISVTKTGPTSPVRQFDPVVYTVIIRNAGPNAARRVELTDVLPEAFTLAPTDGIGLRLTGFAGDPVTGTCSRPPGRIVCSLNDDLPPGATMTFTFTGTATGIGSLDNTASVAMDSPDPVVTDDAATYHGTSYRASNISIVKSVDRVTVNHDEAMRYTLRVENTGPSEALTTVVTDSLPVGVKFVGTDQPAGTCDAETDAVTGLDTVRCVRPTLPVGQPWTIEVTVRVTADAPLGEMSNVAAVSAASNENPNPVSTPAVNHVLGTADLRMVKEVRDPATGLFRGDASGPVAIDDGAPLTYRLTVANRGPDAAEDVVITDALPAELVDASAGIDIAGATCGIAGSALRCDVRALPSGVSATVTVTGTARLSGADSATITNAATVASPTNDPVPGDNTSSVRVQVLAVADVAVTKTTDSEVHDIGQVARFRLRVGNYGPTRLASNVVVRDELPDGLEIVSVPDSCSVAGRVVTCRFDQVAMTQPEFIEIQVRAAAVGEYRNAATVTTDARDPLAVNDSDNAVLRVGRADLSITKSASSPTVTVGDLVTFTITATNAGPGPAETVRIRDELPAGLEIVDVGPNPACGIVEGNTADCTFDSVAPGGSATVTVRARVAAAGTVHNRAYTYSKMPDPVSADNEAVVAVTGVPPVVVTSTPDLVMQKRALTPTVRRGGVVRFALTVTNRGTAVARGVRITDPVPARLPVIGVPDGCVVAAGNRVTCGPMTVGPGQTFSVTITSRANVAGTFVNRASVSSDDADARPVDNADSARVTVRLPPTRLQVRKRALRPTVRAGGLITWRITVRNTGAAVADRVQVCDVLGARMTLHSARTSIRILRGSRTLSTRRAKLTTRRGTVCVTVPRIARGNTARIDVVTRVARGARVRLANQAFARLAGQRATFRGTARVRVLAAATRPKPPVTG